MKDRIFIKGAREHNLKNIDVVVPKGKLVVITGLSGSGKSSLAFDTIYAEGQRRYVESLSAYARQFLGIMEKPDVDYIEGLSPAISIDQRTTSRNPRSTVGTVTEIYDYLRLMFARVGVPHCPQCMKPITMQTVDQMVDAIMGLEEGTKLQLLAPVVRGRKGEHTKLIQNAKKNGYIRIRIDGVLMDISDDIKLEKQLKHTIEIVVDRLVMRPGLNKRLTDSVEMCLSLSGGILVVDVIGKEQMLFSQKYACSDCGLSIEELTPRMFSFNNPYGACPNCSGLGSSLKINPDLVIQDKTKALTEEALIKAGWDFSKEDSYSRLLLNSLAIKYNFDVNTPVEKLPKQIMDIVLYGTGKEKIKIEYGKDSDKRDFYTSFEGIINSMERRYAETLSQGQKEYYESFMSKITCRECGGKRLKKESLAVTIADKNIDDIVSMTILQGAQFFRQLELSTRDTLVAEQILKEINARLSFLSDVGLDYLTLDRASGTLSGGEAQRIRLATQIGSGLTGVLYVLDEPSIGLHQRDNNRLLDALKHLRDLGNSLIVVEHDEETMNAADHIIDMGPGAGEHGGLIMAQGDIEKIKANPKSMTGQYLSGVKRIEVPVERRKPEGKILRVLGAKANNLKDIEVDIPLGVFTCVTGVSGSGKSSLVNEIIYNKLASKLNRAKTRAGAHRDILGLEHLDKVVNIDQSPIGRMPSSNCATYTGLFTHIRDLFASTSDAKMRGYKPGRFSFNVHGGRCEACKGDGIIKIEMHFLSDIYVPCEVCHSSRYNKETLEVKYKGKSIADVLAMTVSEALEYFKNISKIKRKIQTLCDVGLGYITLGQSATTLSGGEAQRVKLATELSKRATGKTMYILDEPTTGLHIADVHKLIDVLHKLVDTGNSVVVIEHNLDVIKTADYIIDLGPEGGDGGGEVVAKGTPEEVARCKKSFTGSFLKKMLD